MSIVMEINPFDFFTDTHGDALDAGFIYIGEPNKDPRQYPVVVYYDEALTIPAAMPLRTSGGYIVRNGSPTFLYINGNYSIMVQDKNHRQIYYVPDFLLIGNGTAVSAGDLANTTDPTKGAMLVGRSAVVVESIADLLLQPRKTDVTVMVRSYFAGSGIGGGEFYWDPASTTADDKGYNLAVPLIVTGRWKRRKTYPLKVNPAEFGGIIDGDSTIALIAMLAYVATISSTILNVDGANSLFVNAATVDMVGRWGTTQQITVPPLANVKFENGYVFALAPFTGVAVVSFNTAISARLSYEACSWINVTIDAKHLTGCMVLNKYNRFYMGGGAKFTGFSTFGLYCGDKQGTSSTDGHELFTDGLYFTEYDFFDAGRGSETGTALEVHTFDNHIKNFVVSSANIGLIVDGPGNRYSYFHIWGCSDQNKTIWLKSGRHTGTKMTDFKLGGSKIRIDDPVGLQIDDWNAEFTQNDFSNDCEFIALKPLGPNRSVGGVNIQNGTIQVVGPFGFKTYPVRANETAAGSISDITMTAIGSGYSTATATIVGDGSGAVLDPYITNGRVRGIRIVSPGSGYTSATVSIVGDGIGASATATILVSAGTWNSGAINGTVVDNNAVVGGTAANNIALKTHCNLFAGTATATTRAISYADNMLFTGDVKVVSYSFRPSAISGNKAALSFVAIDLALQTVTIAFFSDVPATTPVSVQATVSATINCTSDVES